MKEKNQMISFKISLVGEGCVGKTSLIQKFTKNTFNDKYIKTIGANFANHQVHVNSNKLQLMLWDIAGQDLFGFLKPSFLRGSRVSIIVFSLEQNQFGKESFKRILDWLHDIRAHCGDIPVWIFANKADLVDSESIDTYTLELLIKEENLQGFHITSAKTGIGVDAAFNQIIEYLHQIYFLKN